MNAQVKATILEELEDRLRYYLATLIIYDMHEFPQQKKDDVTKRSDAVYAAIAAIKAMDEWEPLEELMKKVMQ
jgi:hypothetical protein